ncbi:transposase [Streptomyces sp. NPDC057062]|uniref:transposase n=1 Tax=Streptomyces sp. NPDC057062 TaxID=3346011 RepID=UPI00362C1C43
MAAAGDRRRHPLHRRQRCEAAGFACGFPPWETVYGFFWKWNRAGVVTYIRDQLRRQIRTGKGRCPHPVTLIVDSQSVKGASTAGRNSRGYDAAKKINGRKRYITVDTLGLPVMITVMPADIQDRDAAHDVFWRLRLIQPQITQVWADRGYAGGLVEWARERLCLTLRVVSRPKGTKGFFILPRRWKVERTMCATRRSVCIPGSAGRNSEGGSWA